MILENALASPMAKKPNAERTKQPINIPQFKLEAWL